MKSVIKEFLKAKETSAFRADKDKYKDFPITFQNERDEQEEGYLQDVVEDIENDVHTLEVIVLRKDNTAFSFEKICKAPKGCKKIDWDNVHCAYSITL